MTNKRYNDKGELISRTVTHDGWNIHQVRISDGTWWNIEVKRVEGK